MPNSVHKPKGGLCLLHAEGPHAYDRYAERIDHPQDHNVGKKKSRD